MSKTYGIISELDNQSSLILLKAKGVKSKGDIYSIQNIGVLLQNIQALDTVVVISVDRFGSVSKLVQILEMLRRKNITFKSCEESYLGFKDGKELKQGIREHLYALAKDEVSIINNIYSSYNIFGNDKYLSNLIYNLCIREIKRTYSEAGILRRRN